MSAVAQWGKAVGTGQIVSGEYIWVNDYQIAGMLRRISSTNSSQVMFSDIVLFDLNQYLSRGIDSRVVYFSTSDNGKWLYYTRYIDSNTTKAEYIQYNISTGEKTVIISGIGVDEVLYPRPPGGKAIIYRTKQTEQLKNDAILWTKIPGYLIGAWTQTGDYLMALSRTSPITGLRLSLYNYNGEKISDFSLPQNTSSVEKMQYSPDGQRIYMQVIFGGYKPGLCFFDLKNPSAGWQIILNERLEGWSVGPNGTVVFYSDNPKPRHVQLNFGDEAEKMGIWLYDPAVGQPVRLTSGSDSRPMFSPDGSTIAFLRQTDPKEKPHLMLLKKYKGEWHKWIVMRRYCFVCEFWVEGNSVRRDSDEQQRSSFNDILFLS